MDMNNAILESINKQIEKQEKIKKFIENAKIEIKYRNTLYRLKFKLIFCNYYWKYKTKTSYQNATTIITNRQKSSIFQHNSKTSFGTASLLVININKYNL